MDSNYSSMRSKEQYEAMIKFQDQYKQDPNIILNRLQEFWNNFPKIKLAVMGKGDTQEDKTLLYVVHQKLNWYNDGGGLFKDRTVSICDIEGAVKYAKQLGKERFIKENEVIVNGERMGTEEFYNVLIIE